MSTYKIVEEMIHKMPAGLDRAILRILSFHIGRSRALSRDKLVTDLKKMGFDISERVARACINMLRKDGYAICSTGGKDGGYYLAANWNELNEFIEREVHSRAMDLLEQEKALRSAGEKNFGKYSPEKQMQLGV